MIEMIAPDGERIAVPAKNEHMQIRAREGNAAGKRKRATVDVMGAMGLDEVRKTTGATDAGNGGNFLVPQTPLLDQFEIQGQYGEISAARTPSGMIGGNLLFGKPFPFLGRGNGGASLKA